MLTFVIIASYYAVFLHNMFIYLLCASNELYVCMFGTISWAYVVVLLIKLFFIIYKQGVDMCTSQVVFKDDPY